MMSVLAVTFLVPTLVICHFGNSWSSYLLCADGTHLWWLSERVLVGGWYRWVIAQVPRDFTHEHNCNHDSFFQQNCVVICPCCLLFSAVKVSLTSYSFVVSLLFPENYLPSEFKNLTRLLLGVELLSFFLPTASWCFDLHTQVFLQLRTVLSCYFFGCHSHSCALIPRAVTWVFRMLGLHHLPPEPFSPRWALYFPLYIFVRGKFQPPNTT